MIDVYVITSKGKRVAASRFEREDLAETYAATIAQAIARERRAARLEGRSDPHADIHAVRVGVRGTLYSIKRLAFGFTPPRVRVRTSRRRKVS